MAFLPDGRLLVIEQPGRIRLVVGGVLAARALHAMPEVNSPDPPTTERGLLGDRGGSRFPSATLHLRVLLEHNTRGEPARAIHGGGTGLNNPSSTALTIGSKVVLLAGIPDQASNHNSGTLKFGLDKTLYVSVGDDADVRGSDARPAQGQDLPDQGGPLVGKPPTPVDPATLVPRTNPFVGHASVNARLVWSYGLRNPFRITVDRLTGVLFIADVGQSKVEEASRASANGGDNFGWPYYEGNEPFLTSCPGWTTPPVSQLVFPILEFPREGSRHLRSSPDRSARRGPSRGAARSRRPTRGCFSQRTTTTRS